MWGDEAPLSDTGSRIHHKWANSGLRSNDGSLIYCSPATVIATILHPPFLRFRCKVRAIVPQADAATASINDHCWRLSLLYHWWKCNKVSYTGAVSPYIYIYNKQAVKCWLNRLHDVEHACVRIRRLFNNEAKIKWRLTLGRGLHALWHGDF